MHRSPKADSLEASPITSSTENRCSWSDARLAATSGGRSGTLYSSRNSCTVVWVTCQPETLVCPERQKTSAIPTRMISPRSHDGNLSVQRTTACSHKITPDLGARACDVALFNSYLRWL